MLYQFYETQRSLMEPFSELAQTASKVFGNPLSLAGQNPFAQRISASYDLMHRLGKDYERPEFGLRTIDVDGVEVAIHERVEIDKPFCELRRFKRFCDDQTTLDKIKGQPAVLIVAPLSGHYATLLRDTVKTMLRDHKVYITDWKNARLVPLSEGEFHLDDYVNYVQEFIRHVQGKYGNCHVMSVCQPTVPVLAAVSLMASRGETTPLSMTMMGGPIDARKSPTAVNNLAMNKSHNWFENNVIYRVPANFPGAGRRVYPGFLQHTGFVAMNPSNHAKSHYDYFKDLIKGDDASTVAHRKFYDEYNAVLDMDADYYLETIRVVFQDFCLVNGNWDIKGVDGKVERVRPADITTTALFSVEGELDDISGSGQTEAVHEICSGVPTSRQKHFEVKGAGHYGIFSGKRWREHVYPHVKSFIMTYHQAAVAAETAPKAGDLKPANVAVAPVNAAPTAAKKSSIQTGRQQEVSAEARPPGELASRILDALPQTQCTRCGYPDCAAYANAIANGGRRNQPVPPGGDAGITTLARITGLSPKPLDSAFGLEGPRTVVSIDEDWCIGCTLCIEACPTDAIVGANKRMHTVIEKYCTGCELCLPVCPVDCIVVENGSGTATGWAAWSPAQAQLARGRYALRGIRRARELDQHTRETQALAEIKLANLAAHSRIADPQVLEHKKAINEAAMARARAKRRTDPG